jgi:single-stranded-DNA-specific exonuclease
MGTGSNSISDSLPDLKRFLARIGGNVAVLSHVDSDGLCSAAILKRFLETQGASPRHIYPAKGENAFTAGTTARLRALRPDALFVLDLGVMDQEVVPGAPTLFIDHHRPFGYPKDAVVVSSYGQHPSLPTSYITYNLLSRLAPLDHLAWLSAVGTAGDVGSDFVFAHADTEIAALKKTDVREAEVLLNSAKRSSKYDIDTAISLLDGAEEISDLINHELSSVRLLEEYRAEVNREVRRCRHERPHFVWRIAIVPIKSKCEIQGLVAETWRRQLKKYMVIVANFGYIEGKVAYVIRTELDTSVIDLMESLRPDDYNQHVVFGHDSAAGAVLDKGLWSIIAEKMGFRNT